MYCPKRHAWTSSQTSLDSVRLSFPCRFQHSLKISICVFHCQVRRRTTSSPRISTPQVARLIDLRDNVPLACSLASSSSQSSSRSFSYSPLSNVRWSCQSRNTRGNTRAASAENPPVPVLISSDIATLRLSKTSLRYHSSGSSLSSSGISGAAPSTDCAVSVACDICLCCQSRRTERPTVILLYKGRPVCSVNARL